MMWETRDDLLKAEVNIGWAKVTEILWQNTAPDSDKRQVVSAHADA